MQGLEKSFKEAALAVIAAENGIISPQKLVHIFSEWINSPGISIRKKLEEALPEENKELMDLLNMEEIQEKSVRQSIDMLMDSVTRIKEKTKIAISSSGDNTSDRLITDETPGRYVIQGEMARGGAGRVLIVLDRHLGREIAMKELLLDLIDKRDGKIRNDPQTVSLRNRFLREARVTGQLEHPSIVPVYEIGRHSDGVFYYTMRMVKGKTLAKALKICNSLEERLELLPHFYNVCNAVAYAHSKGVINRDLKPSNVMIGEFGETVVLDWGLAKVKGQADMGAEKIQSGLRLFLDADVGKTVVGYAIGTPSYMPPEQAEGRVDDIDETSDIYSLGAILYQILTGEPPYIGKTASEILRKVVGKDSVVASSFDQNIPPELSAITYKAMSKRKKDRYSSVTELIDELNNFMSGGTVKVYEYSLLEIFKKFASKNKAIFISSILIFFMLILSTLAITWYYNREVKAKNNAQKEKLISQYRTAQAFNEKAARLESQKQFLSSRIYAAASIFFNPANKNSPEYVPWFRKHYKDSDVLLSDAASKFYHRHFHRGATLEKGIDVDCSIKSLSVSKDGSLIFAGCETGFVKVFDFATLHEKKSFKTNIEVNDISISKDGKYVALALSGGAVTVIDTEKETTKAITKKGYGFNCVKFSEDGSTLLSCGLDSSLKLINILTNEQAEFAGHAGSVNDAEYLDNLRLVSTGSDFTLRLWDRNSKKEISRYKHNEEILKLAVSRDKKEIIAGTESGLILVFSADNLTLLKKLTYHSSPVTSIDISDDGTLFVSSERERKSVIWDKIKLIPLFAIEGHRKNVSEVLFAANSEKILTAGTDGYIRIWKRHEKINVNTISCNSSRIRAASIAENGLAALLIKNDIILIENIVEGSSREIKLQAPVFDVDIDNSGTMIATAGWDTKIQLIDISDGKVLNELKGHENAVSSIKISKCGQYVVSSGRDGLVVLNSVNNQDVHQVYKCENGGCSKVLFSNDGNYIAAICDNGDVPVLTVPSMEVKKLIKNNLKKPSGAAFMTDNKNIIIGYSFHPPEIINFINGDVAEFSGQHGSVIDTAVSSDGRYGATSSTDSLVQLWDIKEHKPFLTINTQKEPGCIMFMPDNSSLGICDGGSVKFYPLKVSDLEMDPLTLLKKMEQEAGMKLKDFYLEAGL